VVQLGPSSGAISQPCNEPQDHWLPRVSCYDFGTQPERVEAVLYSALARQTGTTVTIDEELSTLEDLVRRLKIEYDVYFGGGSKRPPTDMEWRVQTLVKKYSDNAKMSYPQRFKYNSIAQRYALFSDLWRQKLKIKEEGYRRPQDAILGIQGLRIEERDSEATPANFVMDVNSDDRQVEAMFHRMMSAREKAGLPPSGTLDSFRKFVQGKTAQIVRESGCAAVEYTVEVQEGHVRLMAKAKR
jgi:hypothetical protein